MTARLFGEIEEIAPIGLAVVRAATEWSSNADLVVDCVRLGYLAPELVTLDATYGRGTFWAQWQPTTLIAHDLRADGVDFRALPEATGTIPRVVFDPPYMAPGGRDTSTVEDFNDRYGLHTAAKTPAENQILMNDGLTDCARVTEERGLLLVKCMDYINGGAYWNATHFVLTHALGLGLELVDRLEHVRKLGPQPPRRQVHARRNLSTLFVFRKRVAYMGDGLSLTNLAELLRAADREWNETNRAADPSESNANWFLFVAERLAPSVLLRDQLDAALSNAHQPLATDISDYGDEWCNGFVRGQANAIEYLLRVFDGSERVPVYREKETK